MEEQARQESHLRPLFSDDCGPAAAVSPLRLDMLSSPAFSPARRREGGGGGGGFGLDENSAAIRIRRELEAENAELREALSALQDSLARGGGSLHSSGGGRGGGGGGSGSGSGSGSGATQQLLKQENDRLKTVVSTMRVEMVNLVSAGGGGAVHQSEARADARDKETLRRELAQLEEQLEYSRRCVHRINSYKLNMRECVNENE